MIQTKPTSGLPKQVDYWPPGIGYDTYSGIRFVKYPQDTNDSDELLQHVVESWKYTAEKHRLDLPVAKALSCTPCGEHEKCYLVSYKKTDTDTDFVTLHGTINKVDTEYDVDMEEHEVTISITINGTNLSTNKTYSLFLAINRYPEKTSHCSLKELV
jgi:hypothetical protein